MNTAGEPPPPFLRHTRTTRIVLEVLLKYPVMPLSGPWLREETELGSGTLYPILGRLEKAGWLTKTQEAFNPEGHAPRCFYRLTDKGRTRAREWVAETLRRTSGGCQP